MSIPGIPGLDHDEPDHESTQQLQVGQTTTVDLRKEQEWRFEVALGRAIEVKITTGTAELFGTELVLNKPYTFIGAKAAVYTWTGCTIETSHEAGALVSEYVAEEHTVNEAVNVHLALEGMRERSGAVVGVGPRVLILGADNVGKSTLARTLTGYAVRSGRAPVVVNLDPGEGVLSCPGTVSASVVGTILEVERDAGGGWGTSPMSGPNGEVPVKVPLVYYFGGVDVGEKRGALYRALMGRLALSVQGRVKGQEEVERSGVLIDTPGSLVGAKQAGSGYELVAHVVSEFGVNCVVCLGSERLYNDMVRRFDKQPVSGVGTAGPTISVIKIAKSGGVVDRDQGYMRAVWEAQIKSYFYGNPRVGANVSLQPRQQQVDFDALPTVWRRISAGSSSYTNPFNGRGGDEEDEFQPGDAEYEPSATISSVPLPDDQLFEKLTSPTPAMRNSVLAVMNCPPEPDDTQATLRDSSCMGFLYITDIDEAKGKVTLLSPVAGRVPNRALVWG